MIDVLLEGERDPIVLDDLALRRMRSKIPEQQRVLTGRFNPHHAALLRLHRRTPSSMRLRHGLIATALRRGGRGRSGWARYAFEYWN